MRADVLVVDCKGDLLVVHCKGDLLVVDYKGDLLVVNQIAITKSTVHYAFPMVNWLF